MSEVEEIGKKRDEQGKFLPGESGNPDGRPPMTEEEKLKKRAIRKVLQSYIEDLSNSLPDIKGPLLKKASEGDISAIKEVHDRVFGKPEQKTNVTIEVPPKPILDYVSSNYSHTKSDGDEEKN